MPNGVGGLCPAPPNWSPFDGKGSMLYLGYFTALSAVLVLPVMAVRAEAAAHSCVIPAAGAMYLLVTLAEMGIVGVIYFRVLPATRKSVGGQTAKDPRNSYNEH